MTTLVVDNATGLRRGLTILFTIADEESESGRGLGVTQLAHLIGRDKSQVSRSLKVLAEFGVVDRDPTTLEYRIGSRLVALAGQSSHRRLLAAAAPLLGQLVEQLGETAHLSVLQRAEVMTLLSESPDRAVRTAGWIGRTVPAWCTSSGAALLLDHELPALRALFRGVEFRGAGPNAPASVDELHERISAARTRGFALADEEFEAGHVAAGAPVRDLHGRIVAAINVSAPKFRFGDAVEQGGIAVRRAAEELSRVLGHVAREPEPPLVAEGRGG